MKAFLIILKNLLLDYYYLNISISNIINFDQVYNSIKNYFKRTKYKQNIFSKQNQLTFKLVTIQNKIELIEKCYKKLINEF